MSDPIQSRPFDEQVARLLQASHLPTEDLPDNPLVELFGCTRDGVLLGVVGLEICTTHGLLRSLAVTAEHRGKGLGDALLQYAERVAAARGMKELYLLTTTAERYFMGRGYGTALRDAAPEAITRTRQFAGLCPSSSAFMVKKLG
jgi:amino-acid N-acetyltransferase